MNEIVRCDWIPERPRWTHLARSGLPDWFRTFTLTKDWVPERPRWSHLARSGLPAVSRKQNFPKSHITTPLLTKFVRSRWLDIGLVLLYFFLRVYGLYLDFVSVHKHAKKELGQYPAILTSDLVNNPYIYDYQFWAVNCHSVDTLLFVKKNPRFYTL